MLDQFPTTATKTLRRLPNQRWQIYPQKIELAHNLSKATNLPSLLNQLLINRGIETPEQAQAFLNPESINLPSPLQEFPDLAVSLELLQSCITCKEKIAICGDYDADGMTSTALLLRCLRWLGAEVNYAIPSRMHEGYGINKRIVEEFQSEGVKLILTVDNGISAFEPIARARELGLQVIVTDHHDIPQQLPPANAILNPKLLPESSIYRGVAGVGVAYILAVSLAQQLGQTNSGIIKPMLELFTLGTIADLAPLTGVNRRWVKRGLLQLPKSQLAGVQALIQVSGIGDRGQGGQGKISPHHPITPLPLGEWGPRVPHLPNPKSLKPEDIGFRLGPRINAIGRIGDPQIVIELLTTDDMGIALERAMQCEQINQHRQQMCEQIEQEAIALVETEYITSLQEDRVLVVVQPNWHHGVIGIVASRLVERYGVPVFIGTYEDDKQIRGSARGIPEFHVFAALEYCQHLLGKFGGHKAAGGFSLPAENLAALRSRLVEFANQCLEIQHLKPLLKIDAEANLNQINQELYQQLHALEPCGIDNPDPIFWTANVQVIEQQTVGKGHIKLTVAQTIDQQQFKIKAIAWRWRDYFPLPQRIDIAYKLRENNFDGNTTIELELVGARLTSQSYSPFTFFPAVSKAAFEYNQRQYTCGIYQNGSLPELRIKNPDGKVLAIGQGQTVGLLGNNRQDAKEVDISQSQYDGIIQAALRALGSCK
ncbi:single-stranded-DNA-specific exonuclease RecJ [Fischerella thermalis CCMEE 5330]|uniref:Single-stranded-DNA-specific exonuclease RecJ n=1 Tax=Fischerella thermalis CCMEE 5330 TaxID=2019670 RepID=A0A2N6MNW0_9CYAN|nr:MULTISPECIES: DHH family phosphoesterase [Fischerella]PMB48473.1 single-stranded-DNA-specific exonuclease RecJ [Fischerella thermalis CCMEE 5330]BAU07378.1 single-stranded-DNA-specific exonuclease RecJ [Fischerella sp. NIES-3754]